MTRVLVAEEAILLRRRLAVVLGDQPDVEVIAALADGGDLLARAVDLVPDVVVIGLGVGPTDAARSVAALREALPGVEVVVVGSPRDPAAVRAVSSGAIAVLAAHTAADRGVDVVRRVARRRPVLPVPVAAGVLAEYDRLARGRSGGPALTPGERAAILAVADDGAHLGDDPVGSARRSATARNALERLTRHTRDEMVAEPSARPGAA